MQAAMYNRRPIVMIAAIASTVYCNAPCSDPDCAWDNCRTVNAQHTIKMLTKMYLEQLQRIILKHHCSFGKGYFLKAFKGSNHCGCLFKISDGQFWPRLTAMLISQTSSYGAPSLISPICYISNSNEAAVSELEINKLKPERPFTKKQTKPHPMRVFWDKNTLTLGLFCATVRTN